LIDGYNHTFEAPVVQMPDIPYESRLTNNKIDDDEQKKITDMKLFMKQYVLDDRQRAKQQAAVQLQQARRPPMLLRSTVRNKQQRFQLIDQTAYRSHRRDTSALSNSDRGETQSNVSVLVSTACKRAMNADHTRKSDLFFSSSDSELSTIVHMFIGQPIELPIIIYVYHTFINMFSNEYLNLDCHTSSKRNEQTSSVVSNKSTIDSSINKNNGEYQRRSVSRPLTNTHHRSTDKLLPQIKPNEQASRSDTISVDDYFLSACHLHTVSKHVRKTATHQLSKSIDKRLHALSTQLNAQSHHVLMNHSCVNDHHRPLLDIESYLPLPDRSVQFCVSSMVKSRLDREIHRSTMKSYERHVNKSTRAHAIDCLKEANFFERKSWLKQVALSQEMIKCQVQRRIRYSTDCIR
jgi:hypothetical protein